MGKKQTVPDIKRCKSAFCSRSGAGHGAEIGLLNSWHIITATILPLWVEKKKHFNKCVRKYRDRNFTRDTHTPSVKSRQHVNNEPTWRGCTHPTCADGDTSKESRSGPARLQQYVYLRKHSKPLTTVNSFISNSRISPRLVSNVKTAICHQSLNPICLSALKPQCKPTVQAAVLLNVTKYKLML